MATPFNAGQGKAAALRTKCRSAREGATMNALVARKISRRDKACAGRDNPSVASKLDPLDASRSREKITLAHFALAIAAADKRDVIAGVEHDIAAQKRSWPLD
jgi:hypothetical protein